MSNDERNTMKADRGRDDGHENTQSGAIPKRSDGPVARVLSALRVFAEDSRPQTVKTLASRTGLPITTAHRLVRQLRENGFVELDPQTRGYRPGLEFYRLASLVVASEPTVNAARGVMKRIVDVCDETILLSRYDWTLHKLTFVEEVQCSHDLRYARPLGTVVESIWGSSGRAIMAWLPESEVRAAIAAAGPSPVSGELPPTFELYDKELNAIRVRGWDSTTGEKIPGAIGFAAPVFDSSGVIGSLSTAVPVQRFEEDFIDQRRQQWLGDLLASGANELSMGLGASSRGHYMTLRGPE